MKFARRLAAHNKDRGSAPIELAIIGPVAALLLALLVLGGRVAIAEQAMSGVANNAARDASLARTAPQAQAIANASAISSLQEANLHCQGSPTVVVDTSGFSPAPGAQALIQVDVTCVVLLSDVGLPGLPGSRTLHDHASSPLDPYRSAR